MEMFRHSHHSVLLLPPQSGAWPRQSGPSGESRAPHLGHLTRRLLKGVEPLGGGGGDGGEGLWEWRHQVTRAGVDEGPAVTEPAGGLPRPVAGRGPGLVLTEV